LLRRKGHDPGRSKDSFLSRHVTQIRVTCRCVFIPLFFRGMIKNNMVLYTGKGDKGKTGLYHCDQRLSKSSRVAEALGSLDEVNSFLGWIKTKVEANDFVVNQQTLIAILETTQNNLFVIQAGLAGAPKKLPKLAITKTETLIKIIEKKLPPIKNFIISGGIELSVMLDVARTMVRRAERQIVFVSESKDAKLSSSTLAYLNRLSSLLYALARLVNHQSGIKEQKPVYNK